MKNVHRTIRIWLLSFTLFLSPLIQASFLERPIEYARVKLKEMRAKIEKAPKKKIAAGIAGVIIFVVAGKYVISKFKNGSQLSDTGINCDNYNSELDSNESDSDSDPTGQAEIDLKDLKDLIKRVRDISWDEFSSDNTRGIQETSEVKIKFELIYELLNGLLKSDNFLKYKTEIKESCTGLLEADCGPFLQYVLEQCNDDKQKYEKLVARLRQLK